MNWNEYLVTPAERRKLLNTCFASLEPLKLTVFPAKLKRKYWVLDRIADEFQFDVSYTQDEITNRLWEIFEDPVSLRRFLINFGFLDRKSDGSAYWRTRPDRPEAFETIKQEAEHGKE